MSQFITENAIWLAPAISVILSILFKAGAKNSHVPLELSDFLDFGFGLSVTAMILILTHLHDENGTWLLFAYTIFISATVLLVNRLGWNKHRKKLNLFGLIFPDVVGIFLLTVSIIYINGGMQ